MAFLDMFDKVDDIFYKPIETICNWITEPQKAFAHKREMEREKLTHELEQKDKEFAVELEIRMKKAEIELEEFRKDKIFERNKEIFETIKKYQMDMAKVAVEIGNTIGSMTLELRERANNFVLDNVKKYKELQDDAIAKANERFKDIEATYPAESKAKDMMMDAVGKQMNSIIDEADKFINGLNEDLKKILSSIDIIIEDTRFSVEKRFETSNLPKLEGKGDDARCLN